MVIKKAVCMHEEDAGTLWKHTEYRTGHSEVRRSRRLVLSFIATIANYEYGFYWYFYQVLASLLPSSWLAAHHSVMHAFVRSEPLICHSKDCLQIV